MNSLRPKRLLGATSLVMLFACDNAAKAIQKVKQPLDPIVGVWREIPTTDTSNVEILEFKSDRRLVVRIIVRNPEASEIQKRFAKLADSLPATFARGESVVVMSIDNKALWERGKSLFGTELELKDSSRIRGATDGSFRYSLSGDVLELTKERGPNDFYAPKTKRYVRERQ